MRFLKTTYMIEISRFMQLKKEPSADNSKDSGKSKIWDQNLGFEKSFFKKLFFELPDKN